ncbi:hypothetical protein [Microbacterium sp. ABRD28]|uniref:hypothetical protein n=1 Tax=Microbacterium sp. ABRD28 TaxID=2268461 RepID=UPI000F552E96|nr:hypothetical protein [Microbacterium sp. ABRD28]
MPEPMTRTGAKRRLLSWVPISIVALICLGFVVAVVSMENSWWVDEDRPATADQEASDGMSVFTEAGVDYLTREGRLLMRVGSGSLPSSELGLQANETQSFEPIVPIEAVIVAPDGSFYVDLLRSFTITTSRGEVESVQLVREANGAWLTVFPNLQRTARFWGWTDSDLEQLQRDLTAASHEGNGNQYSAELPAVEHNGALVSAHVDVDLSQSEITATFLISPLAQ